MLRGAHGDARRERRHRLVADVLVDEVGGLPQLRHVDVALEPQAGERLGDRLAGDTMQRQRDRIDGARDQLGAGSCRLERRRERVAGRALAVDADREVRRLAQARHELACAMRLQRAGRVVQENARRAEVRQLARLLHQGIGLARSARAVDEPRLELAARLGDGVGRLAQVRDVVERVVQPEDVDAVRGGGRDEAADEVVVDRARADEEAAAQRQTERRLRRASLSARIRSQGLSTPRRTALSKHPPPETSR